jgi:hypothetical protein
VNLTGSAKQPTTNKPNKTSKNYMKITITLTACFLFSLAGCVSNSAPGSGSARINDGRNRRDAIVSENAYRQHHRQRTDEAEEYQNRRLERQDQYESVVTPVKTIHDVLGMGGIHFN